MAIILFFAAATGHLADFGSQPKLFLRYIASARAD